MDVAGGLSLVQTILQFLDSGVWKETQSVLGVKSQLHKLKKTMFTIDAILRDAEEQERLHHSCSSYSERDRLERLKEALYQADDLFDEVTTLAHRKKLMRPGNKLSKEISLFFSQFNQLRSAVTWSREIKSIRERLDDVVKDHQLSGGFRHSVVLEDSRVRNNPRETHSYVNPNSDGGIVGRDEDKRIVINMLVGNSNVEENDSVVSIVGIGGQGKTTLAQLVYHDDENVQKEFPLKMWVCVSNDFDVKALAGKILAAATNQPNQSCSLDMEQIRIKLHQLLDRKKYLLVLDDVWNENYEKWQQVKALLVRGGRGSRVLVTTRSKKVVEVVGSSTELTHELKDLSDEDCWKLFERFTHPEQPEFFEIGKQIVQKCPKVPLAIRVVGSLLRGQGISKWDNLKNRDFANIIQDKTDDIVPVLKISYYDLPFHLKRCFSYCAVFPKDYKIVKEDLISHWMAQGFIMPSNGENFEDASEECFEQLLQRCFFQDVEVADGTNEIISCKMHDLIHDLAREVAGIEILSCDYSTRCFNEKTRHVFHLDENTPEDLLGDELTEMGRMRTFLYNNYERPTSSIKHLMMSLFYGEVGRSLLLRRLVVEVSKMKYVRVLCLNNTGWEKLPSGIGELVHLRYLDLSYNWRLSVLPSSITKLYNLQTLKLCGCEGLEMLPRGLRKLVNLRHLHISGCTMLTHMPPGMNNMTSLQTLTMFVMSGSGRSNTTWKWRSTDDVGQLEDLDGFTNYTRTMRIIVKKGARYNAIKRGGRMLSKSKNLWEIMYVWETDEWGEIEEWDNAEELLQGLQPHHNLRKLELLNYPEVGLPSWGGSLINLQNGLTILVEIKITDCKRLEHLPLMSQLRYLKVLELIGLEEVEYVESSIISNSNRGDDGELVFFPSLEMLVLRNMPKLKGWRKPELGKGESETQLQEAPKVFDLTINDCLNLTTFPFCPKLEKLLLVKFNDTVGPIMMESTRQIKEEGQYGRLREVEIDNVAYLNSLPIHHLSRLEIMFNHNIERLRIEEVGEVFRSSRLSSLRSLIIYDCKKLKSISGGQGVWEHFTALESLLLYNLPELELEDKDDVGNSSNNECREEGSITNDKEGSSAAEMMPWRYLAPTLRSLELNNLSKVVKLPKGIGCLSSLHSLKIWFCHNLESLTPSLGCLSSLQYLTIIHCKKLKTMPEEMRHLTSLTTLHIQCCSPELKYECWNKNGANWSNIQHIPNIIIY